MSWQIPTQIEQDIIAGKAQYRTFQTGSGGQSILPVPPNAYAVVFGYDFSPAGGGATVIIPLVTAGYEPLFEAIRVLETQQISFYTGTDFYPFIHHVNIDLAVAPRTTDPLTGAVTAYTQFIQVNNTPLSRQVYITSDKDITITAGAILNAPVATVNAIPQTNRTPALLTYGGSAQTIPTQTNFGPNATPLQFMQPSPKDYQDFGFGLLPNGANGQAFATPDPVNGLVDFDFIIRSASIDWANTAASRYFLNLHYALYTRTIPEQRG